MRVETRGNNNFVDLFYDKIIVGQMSVNSIQKRKVTSLQFYLSFYLHDLISRNQFLLKIKEGTDIFILCYK